MCQISHSLQSGRSYGQTDHKKTISTTSLTFDLRGHQDSPKTERKEEQDSQTKVEKLVRSHTFLPWNLSEHELSPPNDHKPLRG